MISGGNLAYALLCLAAFVPALGYAYRYARLTRGGWRNHMIGRALMGMARIIAALLGFVTFNTLYIAIAGESYFLRPFIGSVLMVWFIVRLWQLWITFEKAQKEGKK